MANGFSWFFILKNKKIILKNHGQASPKDLTDTIFYFFYLCKSLEESFHFVFIHNNLEKHSIQEKNNNNINNNSFFLEKHFYTKYFIRFRY